MLSRFLIVLCSLASAGCAVERATPTTAPAAPALAIPAQGTALSPVSPEETVADAPIANERPTTEANVSSQPATGARIQVHAAPTIATAPNALENHGAMTVTRSPEAPVASPAMPDTLDFASLGARLRATKAIGVLTKLSVKNQADDLLEQFRNYYKQRGNATLSDLHRSYDTLVLELLSLLHDGDPPLAIDIDRSRAAIWDVLSNQRKFIDSNLMAGASPRTDSENR